MGSGNGTRAVNRQPARCGQRSGIIATRDACSRLNVQSLIPGSDCFGLSRSGASGRNDAVRSVRGRADQAQRRLEDSQGYQSFIDYVIEADRAGLHDMFMVEHHSTGQGQVSASMTLLAYLAAQTQQIRLGTAVVVLPWHNPVLIAEQAATLDLLTGGRFDFGVGKGYRRPSSTASASRSRRRPSASTRRSRSSVRSPRPACYTDEAKKFVEPAVARARRRDRATGIFSVPGRVARRGNALGPRPSQAWAVGPSAVPGRRTHRPTGGVPPCRNISFSASRLSRCTHQGPETALDHYALVGQASAAAIT